MNKLLLSICKQNLGGGENYMARGWFGDSEGHAAAGRMNLGNKKGRSSRVSSRGRKGGRATSRGKKKGAFDSWNEL